MGIGDQLRAAIQWQAGSSAKGFIPLDQIDTIVSRESIEKELLDTPRLFGLFAEQGDALVNNILGLDSPVSHSTRKVRLFAILALLGCVERIADFIENTASDNILPIYIQDSPSRNEPHVLAKDKTTSLRPCFGLWDRSAIEAFEEQQWVVLAPVFGKNAPFINLSPKAVLPFIHDDADTQRRGGTSKIFRVKIHPSHLQNDSSEPMLMFAVKRVRPVEKDSFCRELRALRRFNSPGVPRHPNILEFLSAWQQDGYFNIMFPWAVSDLSEWWRSNPLPADGPGLKTTLWLSNQCLGVASGLSAVHQFLGSPYTDHSNDVGHHGDIKPGNILWFPDPESPNMMGTWKIADFGLSGVGSSPSASGSRRLGCTPAYRAPEYDSPDREIGVSYDIWSLGCVLLECLTWSLVGLDGIKELENQRSTTGISNENGKGDKAFWENVKTTDADLSLPLRTQAAVKVTVTKWMDRLRANGQEQPPAAYAYVEELSALIGKSMLVVEETQRSSSSEIVTRLQQMHHKFLNQSKLNVSQPATSVEIESSGIHNVADMNSLFPTESRISSEDSTGAPATPSAILDELPQSIPGMDVLTQPQQDRSYHTEPGIVHADLSVPPGWSSFSQIVHPFARSDACIDNLTEPALPTGVSHSNSVPKLTPGAKRRYEGVGKAVQESQTKHRRLEPMACPQNIGNSLAGRKNKGTRQKCGADSPPKPSTATSAPRFACPFHKYDPQTFGIHDPRWRTCVGPGWTTIHRVKEHIDRKHSVQANTCSRCLSAFSDPYELSQHQKSDVPCQVSQEHQFRVTEAQRALMRKRPRGRSEEGAWNDIYRIIFGLSESDPVPWPYCEGASSQEESSPKSTAQVNATSLEQFDEFLTQSVIPGADADTIAKIQGYLDLARQFRQSTSHSTSHTAANETVLSSVPSLVSDGLSQMACSQSSQDSWIEMPSMEPSRAFRKETAGPAQQAQPTLDPLDMWNPNCLTKEEEELSKILFNDLGSQYDENDWQQFLHAGG